MLDYSQSSYGITDPYNATNYNSGNFNNSINNNYPYGNVNNTARMNLYGREQTQYRPMPNQSFSMLPQTQTAQSSLQTYANNNNNNNNSFMGRIVDGRDMVKAIEVPFGAYAVFPRADMREIYVKYWNNNGTTDTVTFLPQINKSATDATDSIVSVVEKPTDELMNTLINKINSLESKIDTLIVPNTSSVADTTSKEVSF